MQTAAGLTKNIAQWHVDQFQMRFQAFIFSRRQSGKEMILAGLMWGSAKHSLATGNSEKSSAAGMDGESIGAAMSELLFSILFLFFGPLPRLMIALIRIYYLLSSVHFVRYRTYCG